MTSVRQLEVPLNVDVRGYVFSLEGLPSLEVAVAPYEALFVGVPQGSYNPSVQAIDTNGNLLGSALSVPFDVPSDVHLVDVPATLVVSLA